MKKALVIAVLSLAVSGCYNQFFRSMNGTSSSIALSVPDDSTLRLQVCEYLNGEKVSVRDASDVRYEYFSTSTNTYFGLIHTAEYRQSKIEVRPVQTNSVEEAAK